MRKKKEAEASARRWAQLTLIAPDDSEPLPPGLEHLAPGGQHLGMDPETAQMPIFASAEVPDGGKSSDESGDSDGDEVQERPTTRGDEKDEWASSSDEETVCGLCESRAAVVQCDQCENVMCAACSNLVHKTCLTKHTVYPLGKRHYLLSEEQKKRAEAAQKAKELERVRKWLAAERAKQLAQWRPLRMSKDAISAEHVSALQKQPSGIADAWAMLDLGADAADEQPVDAASATERIVLFEDIRDLLLLAREPGTKQELGMLFLTMLGVPVPRWLATNDWRWREIDAFLPWAAPPSPKRKHVDVAVRPRLLGEGSRDRVHFVRRVLRRLVDAFPASTPFRVAALFFEAEQSVLEMAQTTKPKKDTFKSFARALLKHDMENLELWHAYAEAEHMRGSVEGASKVYDGAIAMICNSGSGATQQRPNGSWAIFRSSCLTELRTKSPRLQRVLNSLVCAREEEFVSHSGADIVSPARVLRARKAYETAFAQLLANCVGRAGTNWLTDESVDEPICFAWFECLSQACRFPANAFKSTSSACLAPRYLRTPLITD